jgi:hypothetical protein
VRHTNPTGTTTCYSHYRKKDYIPRFFIFLGTEEYNYTIFLGTEIEDCRPIKIHTGTYFSPCVSHNAKVLNHTSSSRTPPSTTADTALHHPAPLRLPRVTLHAAPPPISTQSSVSPPPPAPATDAALRRLAPTRHPWPRAPELAAAGNRRWSPHHRNVIFKKN